MKRIKAVHIVLTLGALVVAGLAIAAPDTEPWRSIYEQRVHKVPQAFEKEVNIAFIDAGQFATVKTSFLDAGQAGVVGNLSVNGSAKVGFLDAGVGYINGNLGVLSTIYSDTSKPSFLDAGRAYFNGPVAILEGLSIGHCTLNAASPAVCTDTVEKSTVLCVCSPVGTTAAIAAMDCAVSVSSTTLTVTAANSANAEVNWMCF